MTTNFFAATKTVGGHDVRNITWNETFKCYLGMIYDETWASKWISCTWTKSGKCKNKSVGNKYDLQKPKTENI